MTPNINITIQNPTHMQIQFLQMMFYWILIAGTLTQYLISLSILLIHMKQTRKHIGFSMLIKCNLLFSLIHFQMFL